VERAKARGSIKVASIDTGEQQRDTHPALPSTLRCEQRGSRFWRQLILSLVLC
jgi:hypothetical protein